MDFSSEAEECDRSGTHPLVPVLTVLTVLTVLRLLEAGGTQGGSEFTPGALPPHICSLMKIEIIKSSLTVKASPQDRKLKRRP